jgi:hypothetical protein
VLSWGVSNWGGRVEAAFCVGALEDALARQGKPEIFKTDQGSQLTGAAFTGVLIKNGIAISMDGRGAWRDNVFVERLWRSVKIRGGVFASLRRRQNARTSISRYRARSGLLHAAASTLGSLTPAEAPLIERKNLRQPAPALSSLYRIPRIVVLFDVKRHADTPKVAPLRRGLTSSTRKTRSQFFRRGPNKQPGCARICIKCLNCIGRMEYIICAFPLTDTNFTLMTWAGLDLKRLLETFWTGQKRGIVDAQITPCRSPRRQSPQSCVRTKAGSLKFLQIIFATNSSSDTTPLDRIMNRRQISWVSS